jgi:hypothetical protein
MESARSSPFPYDRLPAAAVWKRSVAQVAPGAIDPQGDVPFTFDTAARVASAGSCFAQRIATALRERGFNYFVAEPGPAEAGYGEYSARFGNIYTTLQLVHLLQRALGRFTPVDDVWERHAGGFVDPLRPRVQPGGFATVAELHADRALHLAAVRHMFAEADVFVFTLGLTEAWRSSIDGTAFPAPPGREFGTFDAGRYHFENLGVAENVAALRDCIALARELNPALKIILTVSPVPLVATKDDAHVVEATTYSKAVLRVAAEEVRRSLPDVAYLASYEVITATFNTEAYFEPDRRNVNAAGVEHVMRVFFKHFTSAPAVAAATAPAQTPQRRSGVLGSARPGRNETPKDPCDEDVLDAYIAREFEPAGVPFSP